MRKKLIFFLLLFFLLPAIIYSASQIQNYLSRAASIPANIVIDTQKLGRSITRSWSSYAQGGEETEKIFTNIIPQMQSLHPKYIRIDHLYDFYDVVQKTDQGYVYDFSKLDKTVDEILAMGALPFFSLSYMPRPFTGNNSVIERPVDWNNWKTLVQYTIEHYSGKNGKNLTGVYYEVWNEPELPQFGSWKLEGDKDYRQLYYYSSQGAQNARESNPFFFGGPSVGSYYPKWTKEFLTYVSSNSLRLDFYSWHRYTKNPVQIKEDALALRKDLSNFPLYASIPFIVSEWGIESENTPVSSSKKAASFVVASVSQFYPYVSLAFDFEIKNGPPPTGGKWGLFTHEHDTPPLYPKPRFHVFEALEQLKGSILFPTGQGTYVKAISSRQDDEIYMLLSNYDYSERNSENVPVTLTNLTPGSYEIKTTYIFENASSKQEEIVTGGTLKKTIPLLPNQIILLTITKTAPIAQFVSGRTTNLQDKALYLSSGSLNYTKPEFSLEKEGRIRFDLQLNTSRIGSFILLDIPYSTSSGIFNRLFLAKQQAGNTSILKLGVSRGSQEEYSTSIPINSWKKDEWRNVDLSWSALGLTLQVEKELPSQLAIQTNIQNGNIINFYPINASLDNLSITSGIYNIYRSFDGNINK